MFLARSSLFLLVFKMTIGQSTLKTISKTYFPDVEYPASVSEVEPFYYKPNESDLFDSLGTDIKSTTFANVTEVRDNKPINSVNKNDFRKSSSDYMKFGDRNNKTSLTNNRKELINDTLNIVDAINEYDVNNAINKIVEIKSIEGVENDLERQFNSSDILNRASLRLLSNKHTKDNNSNIFYEYRTPTMIFNVTSNSTYDKDLAAENITIEAVTVVQVYLNPVLKNNNDGDNILKTNSGPDESTLDIPNHINIKTYVLKDNNTLLETEEYVKNNYNPNFIDINSNKSMEEVTNELQTPIHTKRNYSQIREISSNNTMEEIGEITDSDMTQISSNVDTDEAETPIDTKAAYSQISEISSNNTMEEIGENIDSDMTQVSSTVHTDEVETPIDSKAAYSQISEISSNNTMEEIGENTDSDMTQMSSNVDTDEAETPIDTKATYSQISEISSNNTMEEIGENIDSDMTQMSSNLNTDEAETPIDSKAAYSQISEISSNNTMEEIGENTDSDMTQMSSNVDTDEAETHIDTKASYSQISEISSNNIMEEIGENTDSDMTQISSNVDTDEAETPIDTKAAYSQISETSSNNTVEEIGENIDSDMTQMSSNVDTDALETPIDTKTAYSQNEISSNETNGINVKDSNKIIKSQNDAKRATQNDILPISDKVVLGAPQKNYTIEPILYIGGTQDLKNAKNLVHLGKYTIPLQFLIKRV